MKAPVPRRVEFLVPGDLDTPTGGYVYDRRIVQGLRGRNWEVRVRTLDTSFPCPTDAALRRTAEILSEIPSGGTVLIDGLAMGSIPHLVAAQTRRLRFVAIVHHPLAEETGLSDVQVEALRSSERSALASAKLVIVTSPYTAGLIEQFGIRPDRIRVVAPGTDPAPIARGSRSSALNILCVATLTPRKGHALLVEALAGLKHLKWQLACVGSLERSPETVAQLRVRIGRLGLTERVCLAGDVSRRVLEECYDCADLFALATHFEGYGMALAEALAHGVPVVSTQTGAVPDTVPDGAGLLARPNDVRSLAAALGSVLEDAALRRSLAQGALIARDRLPSWQSAVAGVEAALRDVDK